MVEGVDVHDGFAAVAFCGAPSLVNIVGIDLLHISASAQYFRQDVDNGKLNGKPGLRIFFLVRVPVAASSHNNSVL